MNKVRLSVSVDEELAATVRDYAEKKGRSLSNAFSFLLRCACTARSAMAKTSGNGTRIGRAVVQG